MSTTTDMESPWWRSEVGTWHYEGGGLGRSGFILYSLVSWSAYGSRYLGDRRYLGRFVFRSSAQQAVEDFCDGDLS